MYPKGYSEIIATAAGTERGLQVTSIHSFCPKLSVYFRVRKYTLRDEQRHKVERQEGFKPGSERSQDRSDGEKPRAEHGGRVHAQRPRGFWGKKTQLFITPWGELANILSEHFLPVKWNLGFLLIYAPVALCYRWCGGIGKDLQIHTKRRPLFSLCSCPCPQGCARGISPSLQALF